MLSEQGQQKDPLLKATFLLLDSDFPPSRWVAGERVPGLGASFRGVGLQGAYEAGITFEAVLADFSNEPTPFPQV